MARLHNELMMPIGLPGEHIEIIGGGYGGGHIPLPAQHLPGIPATTVEAPPRQTPSVITQTPGPIEPVFAIDQQTLLIGGAILLAILILR